MFKKWYKLKILNILGLVMIDLIIWLNQVHYYSSIRYKILTGLNTHQILIKLNLPQKFLSKNL